MPPTSAPPSFRRRAWGVLTNVLFLLVVAFVVHQGASLWSQVELRKITVAPGWLIVAIPVTIIAWLPAACYWRVLMADLGEEVRWRDTARAYFCGHLGKYVPGKATALLVRGGLLEGRGA